MSRVHFLRLAAMLALIVGSTGAQADQTVFTTNSAISATDMSFENHDVVVRGCYVTIDGTHAFNSLLVDRNASNQPGIVAHTPGVVSGGVNGMSLIIAGDVFVQGPSSSLVGSSIDVSGLGHSPGTGPGLPAPPFSVTLPGLGATAVAGSGHGGIGAGPLYMRFCDVASFGTGGGVYGSALEPQDFGSGGRGISDPGNAYSGGGAVRLLVGGTLSVNGDVLADGGAAESQYSAYDWGGAAGGSVWLHASSITGTGRIRAIGANAGYINSAFRNGAGGGGRIRLHNAVTFTGVVTARGGSQTGPAGGAGTVVYTSDADPMPRMVVTNAGATYQCPSFLTVAPGLTPVTLTPLRSLGVLMNAVARVSSPITILGNLDVNENSSLELNALAEVSGDAAFTSNSTYTHTAGVAGNHLSVAGNMLIDATSKAIADGRGFGAYAGTGAGQVNGESVGGGGHASAGSATYNSVCQVGALGGGAYGSATEPVTLGSGGGSPGGGAFRISVGGTLSLDGPVSASAISGYISQGGAGGSIWITAAQIVGAGSISADGNDGYYTGIMGAGSGGRIRLDGDGPGFTGQVSAHSGLSFNASGGAGTIVRSLGVNGALNLIIDNAGRLSRCAATPAVTIPAETVFSSITVRGGANAIAPAGTTVSGDLLVTGDSSLEVNGPLVVGRDALFTSNGQFTHAAGVQGSWLSAGRDIWIDATSRASADARGFGYHSGPGAGQINSDGFMGGAGHGGPGGPIGGGTGCQWIFGLAGGPSYGSLLEPVTLGSGGYGRGGGALHISAAGTLIVDGRVSARGDVFGGAGGSLWLSAAHIVGAGTISADGGEGFHSSQFGAGGGGRIHLHNAECSFTGSVSSFPGIPNNPVAGTGTIVQTSDEHPLPHLIADQGNRLPGCGKPQETFEVPTDLVYSAVTLRNGLRAAINGPLAISGDFTIENASRAEINAPIAVNGIVAITGASVLTHAQGDPDFAITAANLFLDSTSSIDVTAKGYPRMTGPGAGASVESAGGAGGAGHGGVGGTGSVPGATGGAAYGSETQPAEFGSGGGDNTFGNAGGTGGGKVRLDVSGLAIIDGVIAADGTAGSRNATSYAAGGGSGGSIWITTAFLSGSGSIHADGGDGSGGCPSAFYAGEGSGGRVAIYSNGLFSGQVTANHFPLNTLPGCEPSIPAAHLPTHGTVYRADGYSGSTMGPEALAQALLASVSHAAYAIVGADQTVPEGAAVVLDGIGDAPCLDVFRWEQVAGPTAALNLSDLFHPRFTAPAVPTGGATLTFSLTVAGPTSSASDIVNVTITNVNHAPVADAGADQVVAESSAVTLNGSASYDVDEDPLEFLWTQTAGPTVALEGNDPARPTFTAPMVGSGGDILVFELVLTDGFDYADDSVVVLIENVNHPPVASAGPDQSLDEGAFVQLDARASSDPDSDILLYSWLQTGGPPVSLTDPASPMPAFTAPEVGTAGATLVFQVTASDGLDSANDEVSISVRNTGSPPDCSTARPSEGELWPPNHKMVAIKILGIGDPGSGQITITILGVTQDEPLNGLGDGDTSPDAVIQGDKVLLRRERAGPGNGRVYRISFRAENAAGQCTSSVSVCVPHDQRPGHQCIDDGQNFNSLGN